MIELAANDYKNPIFGSANTPGVAQERSIDGIITNSQTSYTLIGIVAKENPSYKSGYEVADHIAGNVTLVIVNTETNTKEYIPLDLGPKKEEGGQPGVNLVNYVNEHYPDLGVLVTGQTIAYGGNLKNARNDTAEGDIDDVSKDYAKPSTEENEETVRDVEEYIKNAKDEKEGEDSENVRDENPSDEEGTEDREVEDETENDE